MPKSIYSELAVIVLLMSIWLSAFSIQPARADGPVYIRADGSIDPPTAPIMRSRDLYTLTGNITSDADGIIVERDNIVVDGAGYTVEGMMEGASESKGINLSSRINVTVTNIKITGFSYSYGIYLYSSSNNSISGNNIAANWWGILLYSSSNNSISGNNIANNAYGIRLFGSSNNTIAGNMFADGGLSVYDSYGNLVEGNMVNGKPLIYLESVSDVNIGYAGQVILVNCINVRVENLDLSITSAGVQLIKTNSSSISGNNIARNGIGICLIDSLNNSVSSNNITNNLYDGIWLGSSSNNKIYHNNFISNTFQVNNLIPEQANLWDNGCQGNYWSDYDGEDNDMDGIGDTGLPWLGLDDFPLISPYMLGDVNHDAKVNIVDISIVAKAFGAQSGDTNWNPHADLDENSRVNIVDISKAAKEFGKEWVDRSIVVGRSAAFLNMESHSFLVATSLRWTFALVMPLAIR